MKTEIQQNVAPVSPKPAKTSVDETERSLRKFGSQANTMSDKSMKVAESVNGAKELMAAGKEQVFRIDKAKQSELKQAIANGTYWLSSREIAERILSDTFGG